MSVSVTFYSNFSKRKNSTKTPTGGTALSCNIKDETSILNPVFERIDGINLAYNYCYFNGRYYFIDDITVRNSNIYTISCTCDVLATYKTLIGSSSQFIDRAASSFDQMLPDKLLSTSAEIVSVAEASTAIGIYDVTGVYLIQAFSKAGVNVFAYTDLQSITGILNNSAYPGMSGLTSLVQTIGMNLFDVSAYVSNPMWLPISLAALGGDTSTPVSVGFWELSLANYPPDKHITTFTVQDSGTINVPSGVYSDYRAYDPAFSRYNIYLPGVGVIPLPSIYAANQINYTLTIDIFTGNCSYKLYSADGQGGSSLIGKYAGQVGTQVPYSTTKLDTMSLLQSFIAPNIVGMPGAGSGAGTGLAIASAAKQVADDIFSLAKISIEPSVSINSSAGNLTELKNYPNILCTVTNFGSKEFPLAEAGRPLCEHKTVNTLSGFVKCGGASLEIPGFESEKDLVNSFLNSGFYYE